MLMSLSAMHGHCYIHVTSKSLSMKKSCICVSIMYTLYIQVYPIHGGYPNNQLLNCLASLVTHLVIPILMVSNLQTDNIALKSKNVFGCYYLWHLTMFTHEQQCWLENKCTRGITVIRYT